MVFVIEQEAFSYLSKDGTQQEHADILKGYPVRCSSGHLCLPKGNVYTLLRPILLFGIADSYTRVRMRIHVDIGTDTLYWLLTVGIPVSEIPLSSNKTVKTKNHLQWIKNRKTFERASMQSVDTSLWVEHPLNEDVV